MVHFCIQKFLQYLKIPPNIAVFWLSIVCGAAACTEVIYLNASNKHPGVPWSTCRHQDNWQKSGGILARSVQTDTWHAHEETCDSFLAHSVKTDTWHLTLDSSQLVFSLDRLLPVGHQAHSLWPSKVRHFLPNAHFVQKFLHPKMYFMGAPHTKNVFRPGLNMYFYLPKTFLIFLSLLKHFMSLRDGAKIGLTFNKFPFLPKSGLFCRIFCIRKCVLWVLHPHPTHPNFTWAKHVFCLLKTFFMLLWPLKVFLCLSRWYKNREFPPLKRI